MRNEWAFIAPFYRPTDREPRGNSCRTTLSLGDRAMRDTTSDDGQCFSVWGGDRVGAVEYFAFRHENWMKAENPSCAGVPIRVSS
jgi:hypothetical protein